jgi:hypothetical protein
MRFLSCYRSDDDEEEEEEKEEEQQQQQKQYYVLKPHYVKEIGEFWELKDGETQDVLIMITSDEQKTQSILLSV